MKKSLFYFFMLMAVAAMPLTSCEKDKESEVESQHDPRAADDLTDIKGYNSLSWLQGNIAVVNKKGEVIRRIYGKPLDPSRPDVISAPVSGYDAAKDIFLSWVAPGKNAAPVDGGYIYDLTDAEGKSQGSVSFRAVDGQEGVVARMTVSEGTNLKQISEFNFVNSDLWPDNAEYERAEAGKIYEIEEYVVGWTTSPNHLEIYFREPELKSIPFYCVQGNTDGKEGILVWISPDSDYKWDHPVPQYYYYHACDYLSTVPDAKKVLDFYNNNNAFWNNMLKEMDAKGHKWSPDHTWWNSATGNSEFMVYDPEEQEMYCLDLDDEKGYIRDVYFMSLYLYRYIYIRIIPALVE